jgi:hypothetical protein
MFEHAIYLINYLITGRLFQVALWKICSTIGLKIGLEICWCIVKKIVLCFLKAVLRSFHWLLNRLFIHGKRLLVHIKGQAKKFKLRNKKHDDVVDQTEGKKIKNS